MNLKNFKNPFGLEYDSSKVYTVFDSLFNLQDMSATMVSFMIQNTMLLDTHEAEKSMKNTKQHDCTEFAPRCHQQFEIEHEHGEVVINFHKSRVV